jgi:hypothetical protein
MSRPSPLQQVKTQYETKSALVDKVVELISADEGETPEDFKGRLQTVANAKLLRLVRVGEEAKSFGGREGLVAKIAELKNQAKDSDYTGRLIYAPLPKLLDQYKSLARRAKASAAKAAKKAAKKAG